MAIKDAMKKYKDRGVVSAKVDSWSMSLAHIIWFKIKFTNEGSKESEAYGVLWYAMPWRGIEEIDR